MSEIRCKRKRSSRILTDQWLFRKYRPPTPDLRPPTLNFGVGIGIGVEAHIIPIPIPIPTPNVFMRHRVRHEAREGLFRKHRP